MVQTLCFKPTRASGTFVCLARSSPPFHRRSISIPLSTHPLLEFNKMGTTHSFPNAAPLSNSTAARAEQTPARTSHRPNTNIDDATIRLVVAFELEEARSLEDDLNGTSDCAMARRIAIDQLLSCRAINQIGETTNAEFALAMAPLPLATDTCTCCEDPLEMNTAWQAPCKHWYCSDCLETLIRACMNDEMLYPPRCCVVLPWQEITLLLPKDLVTSFEDKKRELDAPAGERVYCAQPACSHFLGSGTNPVRSLTCSLCHSDTCTACRAASHAGLCPVDPNEAEQQTRQLANEQGWQSCQRCNQIVDLIPGGCNHMTCRCGHEFCYVCGQRWKTCRCQILDIHNAGNGVNQDILAAQERYMEALQGVVERVGQLREAERVLVQAVRDVLEAIAARLAQ